jgi:hypothetical protein
MMIKATTILEEYFTSLKGYGGSYAEIFINPTRLEMLSLMKSSKEKMVRFLADSDHKDIYVWKAASAVHQAVIPVLDISPGGIYFEKSYSHLLEGQAIREGQGFKMIDSSTIFFLKTYIRQNAKVAKESALFLLDLMDQDWTWADRYIEVTSYLRFDLPPQYISSLRGYAK